MDRRNNQRFNPRRNNRGNRGQYVGAAPQGRPTPPPTSSDSQAIHPDLHRQQDELESVHHQYHHMRMKYGDLNLEKRIHKLKYDLNRVTGLLELREKAFGAEHKKNYETIKSYESQISSLQKSLQLQTEQVDAMQSLNNQEKQNMAASLEAQKQKVSQQNYEILKLTLESQKTALLQNELQLKVHQLEQQLQEKDKQLLDLQTVNDGHSCRLLDQTRDLWSNGAEHQALQEKFTEELADKERNWENTVKELKAEVMKKEEEVEIKQKEQEELEEEKKELKEDVKKKEMEVKGDFKKKQKEEKKELKRKEKEDKKELKKKQKEEKKELKRKEKEDKKELKKKQKEEKEMKKREEEERKKKEKEMKKQEKKEKKKQKEEEKTTGFWSWMHRKKCDSNMEVEEAAG